MPKIFIFDTVVLIKFALSGKSNAAQSLYLADKKGILGYSEATLEEFERKLFLPKFDKYASFQKRKAAFQLFRYKAYPFIVKNHVKLCRDPKDDMFLSLAAESEAEAIITLDQDLLVLNPFNKTLILTPTDFLQQDFSSNLS
jgi:uncharacterized protein